MKYIADLHVHSRYSYATGRECTPEYLELWARRKGISIIGTGDFTHPGWREELREKLKPCGGGFYVLKKEYRLRDEWGGGMTDSIQPRFAVTGEISCVYRKSEKSRKVHSLILLPGLDEADALSEKLEKIGNIRSDGRPVLRLDCRDLLEMTLDVCPEAVYVPAHIWTPHFSVFGAFSGFRSMEECFGDMTPYIHAAETGLSSDPPMNRRVSMLDRYHLISNSDAHSPAKLGREATLFDTELSYQGLAEAIQTGQGLCGTIEFFPEEGKYHLDGHRKCGLCLTPEETEKYGGICPVCGRKITVGVAHRVMDLADREEIPGCSGDDRDCFEYLIPLTEVIAAATGYPAAGRRAARVYGQLLGQLGTEFDILRKVPAEDLKKAGGERFAEGIERLRSGRAERISGYDGVYGEIRLF